MNELDAVELLEPVQTNGRATFPAGTRGTVVAVYVDNDAVEVEFVDPHGHTLGLATVHSDKLKRLDLMSAPHPTLIQWLVDDSDPAAGYCRICAQFAVPRYPGWFSVGVCSQACYEEFRWRETLHIMHRPYRRPSPPAPPIPADTPRAPCGGTHTGPCNSACADWP